MSSTTLDAPILPAARVAKVNWSVSALALAALLATPLFLGDYYLHAMVLAMIFLLPALGCVLMMGAMTWVMMGGRGGDSGGS